MIMTPIKKHELLFKEDHSGTLEKNQSKKFLEFSPTLLQIEEDNKSIKHCFLFFWIDGNPFITLFFLFLSVFV